MESLPPGNVDPYTNRTEYPPMRWIASVALTLCSCGGVGSADITENTTGFGWVDSFDGAVFGDTGAYPGIIISSDPCPDQDGLDATEARISDRVSIVFASKPTPGANEVESARLCSKDESPCLRGADSATATFASVEPDRWEGSFRLVFAEGVIAGDFVAERCP